MKVPIPPAIAPLLRRDLNPAWLAAAEHGILRYLAPEQLAGDNGKYMKLYNRLAALYDLGERLADCFVYRRSIAAMRREMMALPEWRNGAAVLYVSVGTGRDFAFIPPAIDTASLNIVGADLSLGMLRRADKLWRHKLPFTPLHCAAEDLPFADNGFDIVFHVGGINFFSNKQRALAEMLRVAKPGTLLMVADETQDLIDRQYRRNPLTRSAFDGARFDLSDIESLIPAAALERQTHLLWDGRFYALTFRKA